MAQFFVDLAEARDYSFGRQSALIRSLSMPIGFENSLWRDEPVGHYIYRSDKGYYLSKIYPADLKGGYLVNPNAGLFSGTNTVMAPADLKGLAAITITLLGDWHDAEIRYRSLFQNWSKKVNSPVYVQINNDKYPWYRRFWTNTEAQCLAVDRKTGTEVCGSSAN